MYRVVLFDFDGTLADSVSSGLSIANDLLASHNKRIIPVTELPALRSLPYTALMKQIGISWYELPGFLFQLRKRMRAHMPSVRPYPGIPELITQLADAGVRTAVITSNSRANVEVFLSVNGISGIHTIVSTASVFGKDASIKKYYTDRHIKPSTIVYAGDEVRDIDASRKAGVTSIAVTWGLQSRELLITSDPSYIAESPEEIRRIIIG